MVGARGFATSDPLVPNPAGRAGKLGARAGYQGGRGGSRGCFRKSCRLALLRFERKILNRRRCIPRHVRRYLARLHSL